MKIKKLSLKNFRGFEDLTIDFPEGESGLAVFVGVNGSGKTSVLEAIIDFLNNFTLIITASIRSRYIESLSESAPEIKAKDLKIGETEGSFQIGFEFMGFQVSDSWKLTEDGLRARPSYGERSDAVENIVIEIISKLSFTHWYGAPIISYYPADRFVHKKEIKIINLEALKPWNVYNDSLNSSIDFKAFFDWYRSMEDFESEQIRFSNPNFRSRELEAVRKAIGNFLGNFSNFRVKRQPPPEEFSAEKDGQVFLLSQLSHGEKMIIALIGDIARRTSAVAQSPELAEGVVLIDEIEQHLHPGWQRKIVPALRRTFPNIQFILTTHSPQVLSTLHKENVFILEDFKLVENTPHTHGRDSNSILFDIFGIEQRPEASKLDFEKLYRMMDDPAQNESTKSFLNELEEKYGYYDAEVMRARAQFEFLNE